ncbi:MAG: hypothetical protein RIB53_18770 [Roseitalea porphyridii]|jgi:hypothetical protein|uniref:hypothetical protein n=1 Tax=Roseitalea porphyridii TaxID=1852022 RepID=UPI0032EC2CB5
MKNRLCALVAGTVLCAFAAAPATAGYTVYVDSALPSVLFVEFDAPPEGEMPEETAAAAPAPVVITGPGADFGLSGPPAISDQGMEEGRQEEEETRSGELDLAPTPQNLVEDAVREEIFRDIELR